MHLSTAQLFLHNVGITYYLSPLRRIYGPTTPDADDADGIMITTTHSLPFFFFCPSLRIFPVLSLSLFLSHSSLAKVPCFVIPDQHLKKKDPPQNSVQVILPLDMYPVESTLLVLRSTLDKLEEIRSNPPRAPPSINNPPLVGRPASNFKQ